MDQISTGIFDGFLSTKTLWLCPDETLIKLGDTSPTWYEKTFYNGNYSHVFSRSIDWMGRS